MKSISEVRTWISSPHSESDIKKKFAEALHKCAVIETSEMKPEFLNYNGFEYIAFENKNDLLLSQIKDKIKTIPKPISIKILPEKSISNLIPFSSLRGQLSQVKTVSIWVVKRKEIMGLSFRS